MVVSWFELSDRLKRYLPFGHNEKRDLFIAVLIIGFIFSFKDWGTETVDLVYGFRNFILTVIVAGISFFVHEIAHRYFALEIGYRSEFKIWWGGLIASLILVLLSNGRIQLILPGGMVNAIMARHRLGEFRYGLNYWENGMVALYGPLANLLLAFVGKFFLIVFPNSFFFEKFIYLNVLFAICTMLPIPPLDGISVFFGSRVIYVIAFLGILSSRLFIYFTGFWLSVIGALLAIVIGITIYYLKVEQVPE